MKKKLISALLCTAMAASLLAGCGGGEKKAENTGSKDGNYEDFITVDVYDEFANYQGIQSGWFAKIVKDKFNMELNIIAPNVAGGGQTLYQTRSAAGELGDLVLINTSNGKLNDVVEAGLVMDATDLMEGKDIVANYGDAIEVTNEGLAEEGMFAFPNSVSSDAATEPSEGLEPTFGPYIRWDYYKQLGYPEMKNLDDFLDVLEDMQKMAREQEGSDDIYAISLFKDWDDNMMNNAKQPCCMYGFDEVGFVLLSADGTEKQSIIDDDSIYVDVLNFFYEANQRGLVDPDSTTQNYDTWSAKYTNGKVLYCPWPWVGQNLYNTAENKEAGRGFMFAPVEDMKIFSYGSCPEGNSTQIIAIGSNAEDPQRMADFIDWLYSPEGIRLNGQANGAAGIEGLTWEMNEEGKPVLLEVENVPLSGLQILKQDQDGTPLAGVQFSVKELDGREVGTFTSVDSGVCFIEGLKEGYYVVTEIKGLSTHKGDSLPRNVYVETGKLNKEVFTNYEYPILVVRKIDSATGLPLGGVRFKLMDKYQREIGIYTTHESTGQICRLL